MDLKALELPDAYLLNPKRFRDARGFFVESYNRKTLAAHGLNFDFVQDNVDRCGRFRLSQDVVERARRHHDDIARWRRACGWPTLIDASGLATRSDSGCPATSGATQAVANTLAVRAVTRNAATSGDGSTSTPVQPAVSSGQVGDPARMPTSAKKPLSELPKKA